MKPRILPFCFAIAVLVSSISFAKNSNHTNTQISLASKKWLVDEWRSDKGISMTIEKTGDIYLTNYKKGQHKHKIKGKIKLLFYSHSSNTPGSLIDTFVAEITFDMDKSIVPACFYSGEGEAAMIYFYQLNNGFGLKLQKDFNVKYDDILKLSSSNPTGGWPKYLEK